MKTRPSRGDCLRPGVLPDVAHPLPFCGRPPACDFTDRGHNAGPDEFATARADWSTTRRLPGRRRRAARGYGTALAQFDSVEPSPTAPDAARSDTQGNFMQTSQMIALQPTAKRAHHANRARSSQRGVSLIELVIGLVVVGLLLALGIPSFKALMINSQIRDSADAILN